MTSLSSHQDLFQQASAAEKISLVQSLMETGELDANVAMALLKSIHSELAQPQGHDHALYANYARLMASLNHKMPDVHQHVVANWRAPQRAQLQPEEDLEEEEPIEAEAGGEAKRTEMSGVKEAGRGEESLKAEGGTEEGESEHEEPEEGGEGEEKEEEQEDEPRTCEDQEQEQDQIMKMAMTLDTVNDDEKLAQLQSECPVTGQLYKYLADGTLPSNNKIARKIIFEAEFHYINENNVLCIMKKNQNKRIRAVQEIKEVKIIPRCLVNQLLEAYHSYSHAGINRMVEAATAHFWWKGLYKDCKLFVSCCAACHVSKRGLPTQKCELKKTQVLDRISSQINFDILGPLPEKDGFNYLGVSVEAFSQWVWLRPIKDTTADSVCKCILDTVTNIGIFSCLVCDNATVISQIKLRRS